MDDSVIDGEVVQDALSDDTTPKTPTAVGSGEILINMESMIKSHIAAIDKQQDEAKKLKEMLDDIFKNDPTYKDHDEKAKEAAGVKQKTRAQILARPQAAELDQKIKALKAEIKDTQGALSDYLQEYARMAGVNEIEGDDGEMREIVYSAKLVRKSVNFK
jgi:predicted RNase H-like nuclease (RuvC/YqgF family)